MTLSGEAFVALCEQHALGQHAAALQPWLRPRIGFSRTADADAPIGASRIGGGPDVPADFQWPTHNGRPLDFMLQINLADLQGLQSGLDLPTQGLLSFFYDAQEQPWGYDPAHRDGHCAVLFDAGDLQRLPAPDPETALPPAALGFHQAWSLPHPFSGDGARMLEAFQADGVAWDEDAVEDDYYDLVDTVADHGAPRAGERHGLGGYSHNVQGDMQLEAQLVSHGLYCGDQTGYQDPRRAALEAASTDWALLLQLDSDDEAMWGDSGMLYWWIRQSDLAARDLSRTWMRLQSC
ncbi:YwqG family protein [Stenotrophomonas sp. GZD-301]|uniref:YwqG family protein n=1 Tax=Stenotrophomonas sp. GZD-301 TaxID=3404814 RepID=UPI003BB7620A